MISATTYQEIAGDCTWLLFGDVQGHGIEKLNPLPLLLALQAITGNIGTIFPFWREKDQLNEMVNTSAILSSECSVFDITEKGRSFERQRMGGGG